ncbi:MAG: cupin domain-containing protein [Deltaproteobacteria bacterium]|nr:cupin domain-containing protein [Kofleriaceae bacterium]
MSASRRHPNVVNVSEVEGQERSAGTRFGAVRKNLGAASGGRALGCTWHEVAPGRAAYPRHFHTANEEAVYVLEGTGTVRIGEDTIAIGAGDFIGMPVGPEHAHQLVNTGAAPLRYLAFSTMHDVEIVGYPDSKKIGAMAAADLRAAFTGQAKLWVAHIGREADSVGYFDGEDTGEPAKS